MFARMELLSPRSIAKTTQIFWTALRGDRASNQPVSRTSHGPSSVPARSSTGIDTVDAAVPVTRRDPSRTSISGTSGLMLTLGQGGESRECKRNPPKTFHRSAALRETGHTQFIDFPLALSLKSALPSSRHFLSRTLRRVSARSFGSRASHLREVLPCAADSVLIPLNARQSVELSPLWSSSWSLASSLS